MSEKSTLGGINMTTLIHVGVEVVVIAGMFYWVQSTTSGLRERIVECEKKTEGLEEIIKKQAEIIQQQQIALNQISQFLGSRPPSQNVVPPSTRNVPRGGAPQKNERSLSPSKVEECEEECEVDNNIDDLLNDEINDLNEKKSSTED